MSKIEEAKQGLIQILVEELEITEETASQITQAIFEMAQSSGETANE